MITDQRYYHFVVMKVSLDFRLEDFWKLAGDVVSPRTDASSGGKFPVEHKQLRLQRSFARGSISTRISEDSSGEPPFLYDIFASRTEFDNESYLIVGFPFQVLGATFLRELIASRGLLRHCAFVGADVSKFIDIKEAGLTERFEDLAMYVVGVRFLVSDDKSLTAIRLGGDQPLAAQIYQDFLREKRATGVFRPDLCSMICERDSRGHERSQNGTRRKTHRSRIHIDDIGNFRFYAHVDYENMFLVPLIFGQLVSLGCVKLVRANPLSVAQEIEE